MKTWLEGKGLGGSIGLINDWSAGFRYDGDAARPVERYLLDVQLNIDTGKSFGWKGGSACVRLHHHLGNNGSDVMGDAQGYSNIDDVPRTMLYELWFQQSLFADKVRIKAGQVDANAEFAHVESSADFLNSSMGYSPTILGLPTYPEPRPSVNVFLRPAKGYQLGAGFYRTAGMGMMTLAEGGRSWSLGARELSGRAGFGYWSLSGRIPCFDGSQMAGTQGLYFVMEQALWRGSLPGEGTERKLSGFFQFGRADGDVSPMTHHVGGGAVWQGVFASRPRDSVGVGTSWVRFSPVPQAGYEYRGEGVLEMFYKLSLRRAVALVSDVQYVRRPGGLWRQSDCVVITPRLVISF